LTDAQWRRVEPLLPPRRPTGRPARDHRTVIAAMLWVQRTGVGWRELPARFGPWQTAYGRFNRWRSVGLWSRIISVLHPADGDGTS
jgi:transposase